MKKLFFSRFLSLFMVLGLLLTNIPLVAVADLSKDIFSPEDDTFHYIYLGEDLSNISRIIEQASAFDEDQNSLLHAMKKYMDEGFVIAGYEEVLETLEHAQYVVERTINRAHRDTTTNQLQLDIAELIAQITDGALSVDQASIERGCMPKDCCSSIATISKDKDCQGIINSCRTVTVTKDLKVCGNALFQGNVKIKEDLRVDEDLKVGGDAVFKEDVKIKGSLTAADAFIDILEAANLSVTNGVIDNLSVADLDIAGCLENLCVENLSVTDLVVTSCMDSLCVENFSAVDAIIGNLVITSSILDALIVDLTVTGTATITDLVVLSCMDTLCVNNLSVTDISIGGTLSVNDIIIDDATITLLSATDVVINNSLTIPSLTPAGVVHNSAAGLLSSSLIVNADVAAGAGIVDTKLATISTAGKVSNSATTATSANTPNTIVLRDGAGNFSAGTITAALNGNATTSTTAVNFSGALAGNVTGTQGATVVSIVGGQTAANVAAATVLANAATSANTANTIVRRDGAGNFSAGTITASLNGNATTATTAVNFSGALSGEVTGPQGATVVTNAVSANTANAIVRRTATGGFSAGVVSLTDAVATGNLVFTGATSTSTTGNITKGGSSFIHNFGLQNTFVGIDAGNFTTTGGGNVGIGFSAFTANTTGAQNTAVGNTALFSNTTGSANTAVGFRALEANTTGEANTGVGQNALLTNTTGAQNTCLGAHTLENNTTGTLNVAVGFNALQSVVNGIQNTSVGCNTLEDVTTGSRNTALGAFAGQNAGAASSDNIYIRNLGANESNTIRIGINGQQTSCFIAGISGATTAINDAVAVLIDSAGQLGTVSSTRRVKHDIEDMADQSSDILNLRPVTFVYNSDQSNTKQYGLIAEEVDQIFPAIVVHDKDGQPETVQYHVLPVLLLNEMKKQQLTIGDLQSLVKNCLDRISALELRA